MSKSSHTLDGWGSWFPSTGSITTSVPRLVLNASACSCIWRMLFSFVVSQMLCDIRSPVIYKYLTLCNRIELIKSIHYKFIWLLRKVFYFSSISRYIFAQNVTCQVLGCKILFKFLNGWNCFTISKWKHFKYLKNSVSWTAKYFWKPITHSHP